MPKGIYPRTEYHKMIISNALKGHKHSEETKRRIRKACKGQRNAWKGGRRVTFQGYVTIRRNGEETYEHRLVMEKMLGRSLTPEEVVHHNGTKYPMDSFEDRGDNRPENLKLFVNHSKHQQFHHPKGYKFGKKPENEQKEHACSLLNEEMK